MIPPPVLLQQEPAPAPFQLPNGLSALLGVDHERPSFRLRLSLRLEAPGPGSGLVHLLARLMVAAIHTSPSRHLAGLPTPLEATWDGGTIRVTAEGSTEALEGTVERLSAWLRHPDLQEAELERLRTQYRLASQGTLERWAAEAAFLAGLEGRPPLSPLPSEAELDRVSVADLRALHGTLLRPSRTRLTLVGDVDASQFRTLMGSAFGSWGTEGMAEAPTLTGGGLGWIAPGAVETPEIVLGVAPGTSALGQLLSIHFGGVSSRQATPVPFQLQPFGPWQIRARVPAQERPEQVLERVNRWLDGLAARPPDPTDLRRAMMEWQLRRRALALHPPDRLVLLDSGAYPEPALEHQVEALTLARFQEGWRLLLERRNRHVLVLGGDAQTSKAMEATGLPPPRALRVVR
jgi:hypothetical protein